jgi:hypothetical protein
MRRVSFSWSDLVMWMGGVVIEKRILVRVFLGSFRANHPEIVKRRT